MAASAVSKNSQCDMQKCREQPPLQDREVIKPSISELTKEVRTNILCTVVGCGKILPNTPALNMHLVKSHRIKEGLVNPTIRKDIKGSQKLYCCPVEGCPRGPNRPFSQFSLVKQHFMKMHAEKKHKCLKCSNGYSTEWDLRRHTEDCGRTYSCTCGCPYASRAALLSHIYRTGHEVPKEHRYPPVKKRKMERLASNATNVFPNEQTYEVLDSKKSLTEGAVPAEGVPEVPDTAQHKVHSPRNIQKLLLPKPKVALVNVPVMQLTHLPVLLPSTESSVLRSLVLAVGVQGSVSTVQLLSPSAGAMVPDLNNKTGSFRDTFYVPRSETISTGVQVNLENLASVEDQVVLDLVSRGKGTSTNIQTDISYLSRGMEAEQVNAHLSCDASVSSCSQTDISLSAQIKLPVSVQTQTLPSRIRALSSIGAQTDVFSFSSLNVTRETQTSCSAVAAVDKNQMDQAMCTDLFDTETLTVSTQTAIMNASFRTNSLEDSLSNSTAGLFEDKTPSSMCFRPQTDILHQNTVADNQTQTMILFRDLENILSDHLGAAASGCGSGLVPVHEPNHAGIDFDFEEFLNATHIQTQTEESGSSCLNTETTLELLDIETQTDFLLFGDGRNSNVGTRVQPNDLELEMFDTQTQTDLNFLLESSGHMPLSSILRQSSFSMSTESSDTETQTDVRSGPLSLPCTHDAQVRLSSAKTQTISTSLHTSNETQTAVDDFLSADLAWNMESHFSSVETQTCEELLSLFSHAEKSKS
nr:ATM interactor [Misgurnus anguillicaudatus]